QVQSILRAAEKAAAEIERDALERASNLRGGADSDAQRTREEAIAGARAHLAEVAQAASALLQRVTTLEGEVGALLDNLRDGAGGELGERSAGRQRRSRRGAAGGPEHGSQRRVARGHRALPGGALPARRASVADRRGVRGDRRLRTPPPRRGRRRVPALGRT